jgi:hypothetical protein
LLILRSIVRSWIAIGVVAGVVACTQQRMATVDPGWSSGAAIANGPTIADLPCDAANLLSTSCWTCHGTVPSSDAPMSLVTYADLIAPSITDPSRSMAQMALQRMQDATSPMPPLPAAAVPADQIAAFSAWVDAGAMAGTCQVSDPFSTPPTCTSGMTWNNGNEESSRMHPGMACISCHSSGEGPRFSIAGTVYPTAHEPDDCDGANGVQVVITGTNGTVTLTANSAGNFYTRNAVGTPYTATVIANGQTRAMATPQTSGDCNACHTQNGDNGAPGRILAP